MVSPNQYGVLTLDGETADYYTIPVDVAAWAKENGKEELADFAESSDTFMWDTAYNQAFRRLDGNTNAKQLSTFYADVNTAYFGDGYYGMCQWNPRHTKVFGKGIDGQCEYLLSTIEKEFNTYGSNYASGFNYNSFKNMNNEQNAAIAFAKVYERCASASYYQRAANATEAYNYFAD